MSDIITAVIALLAVAFAITLGVLLTDLWPWVRKRPNAPKGNDDMTGGSRSAYGLV